MPAGKRFAGDAGAEMTCEEFAMAGLDLDSPATDSPLRQAAREHMRNCPHCAALQENWQELRADLRLLGHETGDAAAPSRIEMLLRQDFRTKHTTMKARHAAVAATWALAAAAVLVAVVSLAHWRQEKKQVAALQQATQTPQSTTQIDENVVASNDSNEFTFLPGSMPSPMDDATVVRVGMQRAALGALGLTVDEEHAADWIQVDVLVGDDGQPQAVRLSQNSN
jgi:predicted anti-sigma-YlaC factor YlaD